MAQTRQGNDVPPPETLQSWPHVSNRVGLVHTAGLERTLQRIAAKGTVEAMASPITS